MALVSVARILSGSSSRKAIQPKMWSSMMFQRTMSWNKELEAKQMENDNPFDTYVMKPDAGTGISAKTPILIPSRNPSRLVGCCCESDYNEVVWFNLEKSSGVQRCECGYYFQLIDHDPLDPTVKPKYGMGFGSGMSTFFY